MNDLIKNLDDLQNDQQFQQHVQNIKSGRFIRDKNTEIYLSRLIYTKELRKYIYNPAIMNVILSDPSLKTQFFRTFGYQGKINFTIYPNAWLRDFPLLDIGENVYMGDEILLGTNQVSPDQKYITVSAIKIGNNTIIDQRGAIGYDSVLAANCTIGFDTSIGIKCKIGEDTVIGARSSISHGTKIGKNVKLGVNTRIGNLCILEDGVSINSSTIVPDYTRISKDGIINYRKNKKVDQLVVSEN